MSLRLSVKAKNWRMNDDSSADADQEFQLVRHKVLERDDGTCKFCNFKAAKWQEVHHVNDDHADNREKNLTTVCQYCHMCQHIGLAGRNNEAVLIWLPEIQQDVLHHLVRATQVARRWAETASQGRRPQANTMRTAQQVSDGAASFTAALREREDHAESMLGTSDLLEIANILLAMPDDIYEERQNILRGFRMLPLGVRQQNNDDVMTKIVDSWMEPGGPYANMKPTTWAGILKGAIGKMS